MQILYGLMIAWILFISFQLAFATDCAPDLSSVGDSVITLSDELSDAYTAEERCKELGGYLTIPKETNVNQTLINASKRKYNVVKHPDTKTRRVWIYYNMTQTNHYKYSLSSNEASPWVSPKDDDDLWYIDLYSSSSFSTASIPIRFCRHDTDERWFVEVNENCTIDSSEEFVLYGLKSPDSGSKAIYAYNEGADALSTRLTDVKDDIHNGFNNLNGTFYVPDISRVWIYYNKYDTSLYKYSLSSNETSPWVSPQHLGHLWYIDLYNSSTISNSIPINFCKAGSVPYEKWSVGVNGTCDGGGWTKQFVLNGIESPTPGYKAIYAYDKGTALWSMRLTDVKDDNYNGFNNKKGTFYVADTQRVWIYYNNDTNNLYKYSLSSNEASPWVSPRHLGHLWYIDLYTLYTESAIPIRFCKSRNLEVDKWLVAVGKSCHPDWPEDFMSYGLASQEEGYKAIFAYDEGNAPGRSYSMRLTDVKGDNYNGFYNFKGTFYAPASDVFIGARYNVTTQQWKWSDGKNATEFTDVGHKECQQKVWDYRFNEILNRNCFNKTYYSCQFKAEFKVEKIECNSTALNISWNVLPLAIKFGKDFQVKVFVNGSNSLDEMISDQSFTILGGFLPRSTYDIRVTGSFVCGDTGSFTSSDVRTMGPGQPSDVTHPYVIKSADECNVILANPLPGASFDITISANNLTGEVFNSTSYCNIDICHIPFLVTDYPQGTKLEFTVNASNCEGLTETRKVAGYCVGLDNSVEPACGPTLISSGNLVETLSNDFMTAFEAASKCSMFGGNLTQLDESDLGKTFYERLTEKYLEDVQRIWIYRSKSSNNHYKYSFTNLTDDDWVVPDKSESISYFDLYNRLSEIVDEIHFCKSGKGSDEKWLVNTTSCIGEEWESGFQLFGRTTQTAGFKRVYMFQSNTTDSVKLKYTDTAEDAFIHIGDFWIPDINVYVGQVTGTSKTNSTTRLHYGNGWEKVDDVSDGLPSYYACSVSPGINLQHVPCDSSTVQVKWSNNLLNLDFPVDDLTFEVSLLTDERYVNVSYQALNSNITNLESRNNYTTTVTIASKGCTGLTLEDEIQYETGLGSPDEVISAYISTSETKVYINVPEFIDKSHYDDRFYEISTSQNMTYNMNSTGGNGIQQFRIDAQYMPEGEETNFTIKCFTCEGSSATNSVAGSYSAKSEEIPEVCSTTLIAANERILTLSDDIGSLSDADLSCSRLGGEIAIINEEQINEILAPNLNDKYLQDLLRVYMIENSSSISYSLFPSTGIKSETSLHQIDFYNRQEKSTHQVTFCDAINATLNKWQVGLTSCGTEGWKEVFALFASNTSQPGYIPIYIFTSDEDFSSKLSRNNTTDGKFDKLDGTFYVPEFNLFVYNEFSDDCQVIRYGDGWKPALVLCQDKEAYYSCQVKFSPIIEPVECDSSKLIVSWSTMLSGIENLNISVEVSGDGFLTEVTNHDTLSMVIDGLEQRKHYSINITAHLRGCFEHSLHSTVSQTTSYGLADPVTNARVEQFQSVCTVIMPPDETGHLINYEISAESSLNSTYHEYELPTDGSDAVLQLNISMEFHGNNERIDLSIRATTCQGTNEWVKVEGFCTSPQVSSPLGVIVGSVCAVLAAAAFCVGGFVYYKRRGNFKHVEATISPTEPHPIDDMFSYGDIPLASTSSKALLFGMFLTSAENGFKDIQEEFESIKEESKKAGFPNEVSQKSENLPKNRYKNIFPMDHARVKLVGNLENDYINASYIAGYKNDCKFIAAQGPRPTTIGDFWMMIWEHNTPVVVMLTGLKENGKTKCEQYWPELGCSTTYGKLKINTLEENHFGAIVQRKFSVATIGEQRMITQYNYIGWPDHGTPITTTSLIHLRKMVEGSHDRRNPIVVHCSAGVGRTGTYIAMDVLFDRADNDEKVNFKKMVLKMRENRSEMVQTWKQYALVKRLVLEYISLPDSDKKIAKLQRMTNAQIKQLADQEFETLNAWRYGDQWIPGQPSLKTYESNLVKIWSETKQKIVEMNASYIEDLKFGGNFIATQCPVAGEEEEFWQMLSIRRASVLVCLDENASLHLGGSTQQYGDVTLGLSNFQKDGLLSTQDVAIASGRQEFFEVCLIKFNNWKNKPPAANELINLIGKMQEMKAKKQGEYVVICCKNGCDKTGTFIALVNILERLKSQNRVDVFRTIKDLRDMRPNMVDSLELYNYCYSVVLDYLSLFNAYDNFNFKSDEGNVKELANDPVYSNVSFK